MAADWFDTTSSTKLEPNYTIETLQSPSGTISASDAIADSKAELNKAAVGLAPKLGSTEKRYTGALSDYSQQVKATNKLDFQQATTAAWQDFYGNLNSTGTLDSTSIVDSNSFDSVQQLTEHPEFLEKALIGGTTRSTSSHALKGDLTGNQANGQVAAALASSQNVPAHFFPDSSAQLPSIDSTRDVPSFTAEVFGAADGSITSMASRSEGETPLATGPLALPAANMPAISIGGGQGSIEQFSPNTQSSSSTTTSFGGFTQITTPANADFKIPGLSWTHTITNSWTDAEHWSVDETLVLSFNLGFSSSYPGTGSSSTSGSVPTAACIAGGVPIQPHATTGSGSGSITATRNGFLILVLHADRGIGRSPAAGVAWSILATFSDSLTFDAAASFSSSTNPNPGNAPPSGATDGVFECTIGGNTNGTGATPIRVPTEFTSESSMSASVSFNVTNSGTLNASGTPNIIAVADTANGTDIETDFGYSNNRFDTIGLTLGSANSYASKSGNLPERVPINGIPPTALTGGDGSGFGPEGGGAGGGSGSTDSLPNGVPNAPLPDSGKGHSLGSSSSSQAHTGNSSNSGISLQGKMRSNGKLTALSGHIRDGMQDRLADAGDDNVMVSLRFNEGDAANGTSESMVSGRGLKGSDAATAISTFDRNLSLKTDGTLGGTNNVNEAKIDVNGDGRSINFDYVFVASNSLVDFGGGFMNESHVQVSEFTYNMQDGKADAHSKADETGTDTANAHGDGKYLSIQENKYNSSTITVKPIFGRPVPSSPDVIIGRDRMETQNTDSWSRREEGEGQIDNTLQSDGSVSSVGGGSGGAEENLSYYAKHVWSSDDHMVDPLYDTSHTGSETRIARYKVGRSVSGSWDVNAPDAPPPTPTDTGDSKVNVEGHQEHHFKRITLANPNHFMESTSTLELATGAWTFITNNLATNTDDGGSGGPATSGVYPDWDPRTIFEHNLDGSPIPAWQIVTSSNQLLYPEGYVAPSSVSPQNTWVAWLAGHKGDAGDQSINFAAGFADNVTLNLSWLWRQKLGTDSVDYDSGTYSAGQWTGFAVQIPAGIKSVAAGAKGAYAMANSLDEAGKCANLLTKVIRGGCFVAGTLVTLSDMPRSQSADDAVWSSDPVWPGTPYRDSAAYSSNIAPSPTATITSLLSSPRRMLVPIEQVPLGARVPTKNPKPWEYDASLPEPVQSEWAKISITMHRTDGGIVDAELIRPRSWIQSVGIEAGKLLPMNLEELQVRGTGLVTSIDDCPTISQGEGNVVTARFLTRQVDIIVRAEIRSPEGTIEVLEGTPIHPIWSDDGNDWVSLGELEEGEELQGSDGIATVLSLGFEQKSVPVYNIEVFGEHVYEVGELGCLVHNACSSTSGNNVAAVFGKQMHANYMQGMANGVTGFKEFVLPSGKRIDFLDVAQGVVYELKPNNPRQIAKAGRQIAGYIAELSSMPRFAGINWTSVLNLY